MNLKAVRAVRITAVIMVAIFAASLFLLCIFEGNIGGKLLYQSIVSGVFCVFLIHMVTIHSDKTVQQPFSAYLIAGFYLIISLLLCFPNRYVDDFAILYLIAIPIAVFYGFRYSLVAITAAYVIMAFSGSGSHVWEIQHAVYAVIACAACAGIKQKGTDVTAALIALILQAIVLMLSGSFWTADNNRFVIEAVVIFLNSIIILFVYRFVQMNVMLQDMPEAVTDATDVCIGNGAPQVSETQQDLPKKEKIQIDYSKLPFELSYLAGEGCEVAKQLKSVAPRAYVRALEAANFARRVSYKFGVNSDLVYTAALYHDIDKIYTGLPTSDTMFPECLYRMIKRQNEKQLPISVEELIVLLSNHLLAIHHYMEKNSSDISISKVIENIFNLQLKKGSIMSAGISMSLYHKMKQEFTNEFIEYLNEIK